ncbi:MAG: DUF1998 domain-containing protein [Candidatus Latescibacterota bacterium]
MSKPQVRASQLITTFGPGAMVDLPDDAVIIAGTDTWEYNKNKPLPVVSEMRLQKKLEALLGVQGITLRKPPAAIEDKGWTPNITAYKFPMWFIVQNPIYRARGVIARRLVHINDLDRGKYRDDDGKPYPVVPVRFVRACRKGHVGDIDWRSFVHGSGSECLRELFLEERGTSGDLNSIWVQCSCGAPPRSMSQAARMELQALGSCNGARPWLGGGSKEKCGQPNRLLIRSASNAYFPQVLSVISIPDSMEDVDDAVRGAWDFVSVVQSEEELAYEMRKPAVQRQLGEYPPDQIMAAINRMRGDDAADDRPVKEVEFEALSQAQEEIGADKPDGDFYAKALPRQVWDAPWMGSIERVVLVHRLREVIAQVGFTRFEASGPDIQGELDIEVERAPVGLDATWVPAVENRGEGIFIQFKADAIDSWVGKSAVVNRDAVLQRGFQLWLAEHEGSKRVYPGLPYYLLHSFSHMLLITISLDCGYPASSLRERVYAAPGRYGIMLYTGSPDAEGTLGGLVEEGRRIKYHIQRALEMGQLCSNDPVCAFHVPREHDQQPLLGSACHGCLLIAETSCEQRNDFLDRALVVPTVERCGAEFFGI